MEKIQQKAGLKKKNILQNLMADTFILPLSYQWQNNNIEG